MRRGSCPARTQSKPLARRPSKEIDAAAMGETAASSSAAIREAMVAAHKPRTMHLGPDGAIQICCTNGSGGDGPQPSKPHGPQPTYDAHDRVGEKAA